MAWARYQISCHHQLKADELQLLPNMISTSLSSTAAWMQIQAALSERGFSTILLTPLSIAVLIIAADYAHMIYLHFKMVSGSQDKT